MKQEERPQIQQNRAAKTTKPCIPPEIMETLNYDETGGKAMHQYSRTGKLKQPSPASLLILWKPWTLSRKPCIYKIQLLSG
jgi:hypothetical protein